MLNQNNEAMVQQFVDTVARGSETSYMLTIARDGESPVRSIYFYDNAVDAVHGYEAYTDWGFAKDFLTVTLYEPNGRVHNKVLTRPRGGECVFVRQDYIDAANILNNLPHNEYKFIAARQFAALFSKDNQRFDPDRFFQAVGMEVEEQ